MGNNLKLPVEKSIKIKANRQYYMDNAVCTTKIDPNRPFVSKNTLVKIRKTNTINKIHMKLYFAFFIFLGLTFISCKESSSKHNQTIQEADKGSVTEYLNDSLIVYQTENLIIKRLSNHTYEHISYLNTDDFGKVACNGVLIVNENKGIVFDTPTDNKSSLELINFATNELKCELTAIIPTHFHKDCVGGLAEFEGHNIPIYASNQTIELLKTRQILSNPIQGFDNNLTLNIGKKKVYAEYLGEGHTKDNIVGYFPDDDMVFGGCLIKEFGAGKGYLGDANVKKWSETVEKVKLKYPTAKIVIPGHGKWGNTELFDYTIQLFEK